MSRRPSRALSRPCARSWATVRWRWVGRGVGRACGVAAAQRLPQLWGEHIVGKAAALGSRRSQGRVAAGAGCAECPALSVSEIVHGRSDSSSVSSRADGPGGHRVLPESSRVSLRCSSRVCWARSAMTRLPGGGHRSASPVALHHMTSRPRSLFPPGYAAPTAFRAPLGHPPG